MTREVKNRDVKRSNRGREENRSDRTERAKEKRKEKATERMAEKSR